MSPDVLATLPTVAPRLVNGDAASHSFDIDELGVHTPVPANGQPVALLKAERPGRYTVYCRPHYDRETHEGMHMTLVVE